MSSSETTAPRQHAFTGPALTQLPEPTHAERVRAPDILAHINADHVDAILLAGSHAGIEATEATMTRSIAWAFH
jgi:hypothetical protein